MATSCTRKDWSQAVGRHPYDHPEYYDLAFNPGSNDECRFLTTCFEKHAKCSVRRVFEPACGTGRLLIRLAQHGFVVEGIDLNERAVEYCNNRFWQKGLDEPASIADMTAFRPRRKADAVFCTINSVRHLLSETDLVNHLESVALCLKRGGLYVLGLHLIPTAGERLKDEIWKTRRGRLSIKSRVWSKHLDLKRRREQCGIAFKVRSPKRRLTMEGEITLRTYTAKQLRASLRKVPDLRLIETYDFSYDTRRPIQVNDSTQDIIYILRRE